jgi:hypothetical protein
VRECFLTKAPAQTKGIVSGPTLHARHRDDALLHGLARHITLDEHPKTLLGLAVAARAEKWLRRRLWMREACGTGCAFALEYFAPRHPPRA